MTFAAQDLKDALKGLDSLRYGSLDLPAALRLIVDTTHALFSVDGAALMLIDGELALRNAAVSDERLSHLEQLQLRYGTGPCIDAFDRRELVSSDDLAHEERWGDFPAEALELGMRALLVSPIPYASDAVGVVAVFSSEPHAWTPEGELAVMAFTDLAALTITSTMRSEQRGEASEQLQRALDARVVIEQAKGVLVAQEGLTPRAAFERLRADARRSRRRLADLAAEVVRTASP